MLPGSKLTGPRTRCRGCVLLVLGLCAALALVLTRWLTSSRVPQALDVVFVLDATGSMDHVIAHAKAHILELGSRLAHRRPRPRRIRFGAVFYRSSYDREVYRAVPLTSDLQSVRDRIQDVDAAGGWGAQHLGLALHQALDMEWHGRLSRTVRLIYVVADAPAHHYDDGFDVASAVERAQQQGVKIHAVGCVGLRPAGEDEFRDMAQQTGGIFQHLTYVELEDQQSASHGPSSSRSSARLDFAQLGSSLSLRSFARLGASLSVLDFLQLGSSLSLRSYGRLGAALSVVGFARSGASMSVLDLTYIGSSISIRSFARLGASASVLDLTYVGSSISVRSFAGLGASMSLHGATPEASEMSASDAASSPHKDNHSHDSAWSDRMFHDFLLVAGDVWHWLLGGTEESAGGDVVGIAPSAEPTTGGHVLMKVLYESISGEL